MLAICPEFYSPWNEILWGKVNFWRSFMDDSKRGIKKFSLLSELKWIYLSINTFITCRNKWNNKIFFYPIKLSLWAKGLLLLSMKDCLCMNGDRLFSMKLCLCMKGDLLSSRMKFCRCMNGDRFISINCCLRMNGFLLTSAFRVIDSIFSRK